MCKIHSLVLIGLLLPLSVWADDPDCSLLQVEELEGRVTVRSGSAEPIEVVADDVFSPGDQLETAEDSWVDLRFCDGGVTRIGENSSYEFLLPEEEADWVQWSFSLLRGSLRALIQGDQDEIKFRLKTPTAAMGVRGTEFLVDVTDEESQVYTLEGSVLWGDVGEWQQLSRRADQKKLRFQEVKKDFSSSFRKRGKRSDGPRKFAPGKFAEKRFQLLKKRNLNRTQGFRAPRLGKKNSPLFQKNRPILQKRMQQLRERPKPAQRQTFESGQRPGRQQLSPRRAQPQKEGRFQR
jgi:hypothetical protein